MGSLMKAKTIFPVFKAHTKAGIVEFLPYHNGPDYLNLSHQDNTAVILMTTVKQKT